MKKAIRLKSLCLLGLALLAGSIVTTSCSSDNGEEEGMSMKPDIALNKETLVLEVGSTERLVASFTPAEAPNKGHTWTSSAAAVASVDETGLAQYNTLKEKGFYSNILGTSAVFSIFCDSIRFDAAKMEFTYYGRQRIERRSNILMRELVTAGQLKRVPRTENNPHGLLIVNWRTLLNKDIEQKTKNNY